MPTGIYWTGTSIFWWRMIEMWIIAILLALLIPAMAAEVEVVPAVKELHINGQQINEAVSLNITIPSRLHINWTDKISGEISGELTFSSFEISRISFEGEIEEDFRICEFILVSPRIEISVGNIPRADRFEISMNGKQVQYFNDRTELRIVHETALPANLTIEGFLKDEKIFDFSAIIRSDGFPEVKRFWTQYSQPISVKVVVNSEKRAIPVILKPLLMNLTSIESLNSGYEILGRPIGDALSPLRITITDAAGNEISANVTVKFGDEELKAHVKGTAVILVPKSEVLLTISAEGYKDVEKRVNASSLTEMKISLEKKSNIDRITEKAMEIVEILKKEPVYLLMLLFGILGVVLLVVRR